jgi:hypothetical protein
MQYTRVLPALFLALSAVVGCKKDPAPAPAPAAVDPGVSRSNRLKFKGGERLAADLATGLGLERGELCSELGLYDCKAKAHNIALGGVEPYVQTIYTPVGELSVSTSNAVDRIALSACQTRAERDFNDASKAILFTELAADPNGATSAKAETIAKRLYRNLLNRDATSEEIAHMVAFWNDLRASEKEPAKAFSIYACFAIATTEEALFF